MKTKNKMKESKAKSKEWWEVTKEYFLKELEKNMAQHRKNEKKLRYKLETYQKKNLDFIYYNPTSIKALNQDEETEGRPNGTIQEEEVQIEEPQYPKNGVAQEEVQTKKPQDVRGRGHEKKKPQRIQEQEQVEIISTIKEEVSKIHPLE